MQQKSHISRISTLIEWLALFVISFLFLLFVASAPSPLFPYLGEDYGIFTTFGDYWLNKGVIYKELFDNKGPYLFAIQALGILICPGKWGIFILETLNLTICLKLLNSIGVLISGKKSRTYVCLIIYLSLLALFIWRGDTVEEWSMPFVLYPLYLYFKNLFKKNSLIVQNRWLIYGACFGIIAFMRINDSAIIVGIVVVETITQIRKRDCYLLFKNTILAAIGLSLTSLPPIIYFYFHDSLNDMIYATFTYNIKYKSIWKKSEASVTMNAKMMMPMIMALVCSWLYDRKRRKCTFLLTLVITAATFITFIDGACTIHYFIMILPVLFLSFEYASSLNWQLYITNCIIIILFYLAYPPTQYRINYYLNRDTREHSTVETPEKIMHEFGRISESESDSIYILNPLYIHWDFLHRIGKYPIGKYFTQQEEIKTIDPYVERDMIDKFKEANAIWVIGTTKIGNSVLNEFADNYQIIDSVPVKEFNTKYYFHKRKDLCLNKKE